MARIAYIDHSFHKKTQSNDFLADLLRRGGHEVELFWNDAWKGRAGFDFERVKNYDIILIFQVPCEIGLNYFCRLHPNVIFVPMLDDYVLAQGAAVNHLPFWEPWHGSKIISFSRALHHVFSSLGIASFPAGFYPEAVGPIAAPVSAGSPAASSAAFSPACAPAFSGRSDSCGPDVENVAGQSEQSGSAVPSPAAKARPPACEDAPPPGLRGFAWIRNEAQVSWPLIRTLIGDTRFAGLHLHFAADPDTPPPTRPTPEEAARLNITVSDWFENKDEFWRVLERANVFFAPRLTEGIGMSFLEAMARGQCVVAPDRPTMNEYILHGVNGLLYDPLNPQPLDFSGSAGQALAAGKRAAALGHNALLSVMAGRERWLERERALLRFIETSSAEIYADLYRHPFINSGYACAGYKLSWRQRLKSTWLFRKTEMIWRPLWRQVRRITG